MKYLIQKIAKNVPLTDEEANSVAQWMYETEQMLDATRRALEGANQSLKKQAEVLAQIQALTGDNPPVAAVYPSGIMLYYKTWEARQEEK